MNVNFYLVDDLRTNIRRAQESISKINEEKIYPEAEIACFWIDECGNKQEKLSNGDIVPFTQVNDTFKENINKVISAFAGEKNVFLIDLALTSEEQSQNITLQNFEFVAQFAANLIKYLKEKDPKIIIKVISRFGETNQNENWKKALTGLLQLELLEKLPFIPSYKIFSAYERKSSREALFKQIFEEE